MTATARTARAVHKPAQPYVVEEQVGFLLRQVHQRHTAIFMSLMDDDFTPTQWTAMQLLKAGPCSQNLLGRRGGMDAATIKGVIDRLTKRRLLKTFPDSTDGRLRLIALTEKGRHEIERRTATAVAITEQTLAPLSFKERETLATLLKKML